ncbi:SDR family oxidoreductase [Amycolatopsis sp. FDAARGOS 1241]|uniref:SDR family oxidoreductase n=1 Tax=Amycolatopsis sp. FDAARGOS 1241 TaxID=2778070 RepID=UPI00351C76AD
MSGACGPRCATPSWPWRSTPSDNHRCYSRVSRAVSIASALSASAPPRRARSPFGDLAPWSLAELGRSTLSSPRWGTSCTGAGYGHHRVANVTGTRNALDFAADAGLLHHVSSIAVTGGYAGRFTEADFDPAQTFGSPYHATKFESEELVRTPLRVYRPSAAVGDRAPARWTRSPARTAGDLAPRRPVPPAAARGIRPQCHERRARRPRHGRDGAPDPPRGPRRRA